MEMKLNIQLFADSGNVTYNKADLEQVKNELDKVITDISEALDLISQYISEVYENNFDEETKANLDEVLKAINAGKTSHVEALSNLEGFITSLLGVIASNESQMGSELSEWLSTFKNAISGVKQAYTAEGAEQGIETVKTAAQEMVSSGLKISGYTRGIVNESVNMLVSGGKLIKGVTGQSPQQLVQTGIGTIKTLLSSAGSNPGGTIVSQLFGKLGQNAFAFFNA
jgi:ABC-type transporter Mla subunit MlaD